MGRKRYHVTPDGGDWRVKAEGAERASGVFENKDDAVKRAVELAKSQQPSQVIVHRRGPRGFQSERTYKFDPYPPKG